MPRRARYTATTAQPSSAEGPTTGHLAEVRFARDQAGVAYAIEVVKAERWSDAWLVPPDPERADVRMVQLRHGSAPPDLPGWLAVQQAPSAHRSRAAEAATAYRTAVDLPITAHTERLWHASPHHTSRAISIDEFMLAAGTAVTYPAAAPVLPAHAARLLREYAGGADGLLHTAVTTTTADAEAFERWLRYAFGTPDALATAILLDRIERSGDVDTARLLRFVAATNVPEHDSAFVELAVDRRVVLEHASPWRYLRREPFAGALAAAKAWRQRYRTAYAAAYRAMQARVTAATPEHAQARAAAAALRRLSAIPALGPAVGLVAADTLARALSTLAALPAEPDPDAPTTTDVPLGGDPPALAAAAQAAQAIRGALEEQRRRLAAATVHRVLARSAVPALDRLLQAIAASDLDGIDRVLDDALAAHIDAVLTAGTLDERVEPHAAPDVFAAVAARWPVVTEASLDDVVAALRAALEASIAASPDGHIHLMERNAVAV